MTTTISIQSQSRTMSHGWAQPSPVPIVIVNGVRANPHAIILTLTGLRVIMFDPNGPPQTPPATGPSPYLFDALIAYPPMGDSYAPWVGTYAGLFNSMMNTLYGTGDPNNLFFLIASCGLDAGMIPPPHVAEFLFGCGAGPQLQSWLRRPFGSADLTTYVSKPANYLFVGYSGAGYNKPLGEKFEMADSGSLTSNLSITF